jgi:hypothetical protein
MHHVLCGNNSGNLAIFAAIRRVFVSGLAAEHQHVTSYPALSGKASQSVSTRY